MKILTALFALSLLSSGIDTPALAQQAPADFGAGLPAERVQVIAPPLRLAQGRAAVVARLLPAAVAAADQVEEVRAWNRARRRPFKVGFERDLPTTVRVAMAPSVLRRATSPTAHAGGLLARAGDAAVWGGEVQVEDAYLVRLHLSAVSLPAGTQIWVYGPDGDVRGPIGLEARSAEGGIWTPPVSGGVVRLEVRSPAADLSEGSGFRIDRVAEILPIAGLRRGEGLSTREGECIVDAQCDMLIPLTTTVTDAIQSSSARILYQSNGGSFICSGGLLNDLDQTTRQPFFLTANHCISQVGEALSVTAYWDDETDACDGTPMPFASLPTSNGAQLLETNASSDFTLLRFYDVPNFANRTLLGWNADPNVVPHGTTMHRVSLPAPDVDDDGDGDALWQHYSRGTVDTGFPQCPPINRPSFIYSIANQGGTFGGSSGSPSIIEGPTPSDLWVVGQLFGACGPDPNNGCDYSNAEIDGAFSASFGQLGSCLAGTGCCGPVGGTLCLQDERFQVTMDWRGAGADPLVPANVVQGTPSDDSGLFYFLNPNNWEMLVKMVDACGFNNRYWVFFAATTNVEFTLTVTDTQTGQSKVYANALGNPADPIQDTQAFATCP